LTSKHSDAQCPYGNTGKGIHNSFSKCTNLRYNKYIKPNTHRRRRLNSTVELSRVGDGGVYWALDVFMNS